MKLCIDQGNTRTKIALFEKDELIDSFVIDSSELSAWEDLYQSHKISKCILSSVNAPKAMLIEFLQLNSEQFIILDEHTPIPIKNNYKTPATLGKDRLAAVIGANYLQANQNCLVIDAGTAITYDYITANATYHGGTIAPGLQMRFKALNHFTEKLPLISAADENPLLGLNTEEAIRSGVINGMLFEIEGYIKSITENYGNLSVFLTGGDCFFFEDKLKSSIFANPNLVFIGLNRIINYNA